MLQVLEATIGGTKRHLLDLAGGLRAAGWDVEVACPRVRAEALGDTSFWDDVRAAGVPAHAVAMRRRPLDPANAGAVIALARLIRRGRFDVVHAQSSIAGALARPAALLSGRRPVVVYTPHGFAFLGATGGGRTSALFLAVERLLGRVTDRLIAVSPTEAAEAAARGVIARERIAVIPNGIARESVPASRRRIGEVVPELAGWNGLPVAGTLARVVPQKDPHTWLRVAARVATRRPDARFVWVWGEPDDALRGEIERTGLGDRLRFLGYRPNARDIIAAMDVFLLTSVFEGLPYSPIEALACGTPVVATDVVGTRDVVRHGETGLLAPAGDVEALAGHVLHLIDDPATARRLAEAGRDDVFSRFSVEAMVAQTAAVYQDVLHLRHEGR